MKTKIALNISLLLLISAVITDVLVITVMQAVLVRSEVAQYRSFLSHAGNLFLNPTTTQDEKALDEKARTLSLLFEKKDLSAVLFSERAGLNFYGQYNPFDSAALLKEASGRAILQNQFIQEKIGLVWAVFWYHPQSILLAFPIKHGNERGTVAALFPLKPIYQQIQKYHIPILGYILINTGILTLVGLYRIFRLYLKPIDRIVRQADDYHEDDDIFFAFRREDSELNRLSSALNRMVNKIEQDKKSLKLTVASLEQVNSELKKAQNELVGAEKMASVGRLAAGVAHEIGNPIGIVLGYLQLLKQDDLEKLEQQDYIRRAEKETERVNAIIRQLLDLARSEKKLQWRINCIDDILEDVVTVLRLQPIMSGITMQTQLNAEKIGIWADADQLRQVFLNLLLNCADAINSDSTQIEGRITVSSCVCHEASLSFQHWLQIQIHDNGPGVPPEQIHTIFDPFFTTKEPGKGTGLGLSVSYMIIEEFGGKLTAESSPGQGTIMTIRLPLPSVHYDRLEDC